MDEQRGDAADFLEAAIEQLHEIPWIAGVEWQAQAGGGMRGRRSRHPLVVENDALRIKLYAERSFSAALLVHCHLLIQVLGHFYVAKRRENEEADQAHLRALYETGARLTHDIKNLLQALDTLAGALAVAHTPSQEQRGFHLLKRRLPDIARRLRRALDKLERPVEAPPVLVTAERWWQSLREHLADRPVTLAATLTCPRQHLPRDCFDSVIDNFVDNALSKLAAGQAHTVHVDLVA
jgi:hypothetical protein